MPTMRVLRSYTDEHGVLRRVGDLIHCSDDKARELSHSGHAAESPKPLGPEETKDDAPIPDDEDES